MAGRKLPVLPSLTTFPESGDYFYVVDVSDTSESPQGTSKKIERQLILDSGISTITPVITVGSGSCTDVTVYFYRIGGNVHFDFFARTFTIANTETFTSLTIDLTGTGFEPSTDFSSTQDVFGFSKTSVTEDSSGNKIESSTLQTDAASKKIAISVGLVSASSGDFSTSLSGSGSYSIL